VCFISSSDNKKYRPHLLPTSNLKYTDKKENLIFLILYMRKFRGAVAKRNEEGHPNR
jgi:hypothetical protein